MKRSLYSRLGMTLVLMCAVTGTQVWAQSQEAKPAPAGQDAAAPAPASPKEVDDNFVIGAGDVLAINVWKEPDVSKSFPVRSDGKITLPLAGEIEAAGKTPKQLQIEVAAKLSSFISDPDVTVIVQEIRSHRYNILGQIAKPGSYMLTNSTTVLDAVAQAGGFRDFAKKKSMYVLRSNTDGTQTRLPFNYNEVIQGKNPGQNIVLKPKDTIVVP